jgi:hypothetical protein
MISFWQIMPISEGVVENRFSEAASKNYIATYNEVYKDSVIKGLQSDIDMIQEEIDTYNYTKEI